MLPAASVSGFYLAHPGRALFRRRQDRVRPARGLRGAQRHRHRDCATAAGAQPVSVSTAPRLVRAAQKLRGSNSWQRVLGYGRTVANAADIRRHDRTPQAPAGRRRTASQARRSACKGRARRSPARRRRSRGIPQLRSAQIAQPERGVLDVAAARDRAVARRARRHRRDTRCTGSERARTPLLPPSPAAPIACRPSSSILLRKSELPPVCGGTVCMRSTAS